ncbi:hypothetical protein ABIB57_000646 [Devosia sp. UYZn731]
MGHEYDKIFMSFKISPLSENGYAGSQRRFGRPVATIGNRVTHIYAARGSGQALPISLFSPLRKKITASASMIR